MAHLSSTIPAQSSRTRGPAIAFLRRRWDFAAVLLLVITTIPPTLIARKHMDMIVTANLDDSWFIDSSYKATHGIWLGGGSVLFTYGPIMQWLFSAPVRWTGYSMGKVYNTYATFPMWLALLLSAFTLLWLLPEQPAWKRFVLLIFLALFWAAPDVAPIDVRPYTALFLFVLFLKGWYAVGSQRMNPIVFGASGALFSFAAFLVTADTGAHSFAAFFIALAGVAFDRPRVGFFRRSAIVLVSFTAGFGLLVLLLNALTRRLFDFTFWKVMLALVSSYRWFEPFAMDKPSKVQVVATLVAGIVIFSTRRLLPRNEETFTARKGFLVAAFLFGFLYLQTAFVRSDSLHVAMGMFPMTALMGAVFFGFPAETALSTAGVLLAVVLSWFLTEPNPTFLATKIHERYDYMIHPRTECPEGWADFDRMCFPTPYTQALEGAKTYVQQRTSPEQSIFVFPWNNIFGSITRRNVAGGLLQSYLASDSYLNSVHVAPLERTTPDVGLYFDESWGWPVDKVPNFTRNPDYWFWIWSHYRSDQQLPSGIVGLRLDPSRASRVQRRYLSLQPQSRDFPIVRRASTIELGKLDWPDNADLLRLRINVHYPFWWRLRKPSEIKLQIMHADGSSKEVKFVLPPNKSVDTWFVPWDASVVGFFSADETQWHQGNRPKVTSLRLFVSPMDWVSVIPSSISLEAIDAVSLTLAPQATTSPPPVRAGSDLITDKR